MYGADRASQWMGIEIIEVAPGRARIAMTVRPDRFDEMRRAWIAAHQGTSTIQRRRAEVLGRDVRARQRAVANAVPDPHDDTVLPPLWLRNAHSPAAQLELMGVLALTLLAPLGWPAGWLVKTAVTRLIPQALRAFPIAALLWSGAGLGALIVLTYDPAPIAGQPVLLAFAEQRLFAVIVLTIRDHLVTKIEATADPSARA